MTDSIPLPSQGIFYKKDKYDNPLEYLEVGYLTTEDEIVLCTPNLFNRGEVLYRILERKIEPYNDIKVDDLLVCDKETILLWLRESSFGNIIDYIDKSDKRFIFDTHNIRIKQIAVIPDEDGLMKLNIKTVPDYDIRMKYLTVLDERKYKAKDDRINFYCASIHSINGEVWDMATKRRWILNTPVLLGREIKKEIDRICFGVDRKTIFNYDGKNYNTQISIDELFFGVSKDNLGKSASAINDSVFYLCNEGQGYSNSEVMSMPTHLRLFHIEKLSAKIKKHNDSLNSNSKK